MTTYAEWLPSTLTGFLRRHWGARLAYIPALLSDAVRALALESVRAGIISEAPDDGLPYIGADRVLEHGIGETADAYRDRCQGAWDSREFGGTAPEIQRQFEAWLPGAGISVLTPRDWEPGGDPDFSRIWIVVEKPHPWADILCGTDEYPCGTNAATCGSTARRPQVRAGQRTLRGWKPYFYRGIRIVLNLSETPLSLDTDIGTFTGGNPIYWSGRSR